MSFEAAFRRERSAVLDLIEVLVGVGDRSLAPESGMGRVCTLAGEAGRGTTATQALAWGFHDQVSIFGARGCATPHRGRQDVSLNCLSASICGSPRQRTG